MLSGLARVILVGVIPVFLCFLFVAITMLHTTHTHVTFLSFFLHTCKCEGTTGTGTRKTLLLFA